MNSISNKSASSAISSPSSLNYLDLKENSGIHYMGRFRPLPMRMTNFLKLDVYPDRYSHMKTTRFDYPEDQSSVGSFKPATTSSMRNVNHRVAVESWPSPLLSTAPHVVMPVTPTSPTQTTTGTTTTTTSGTTTQPTALLSEQDTNKHNMMPKSTRKPKRRNNMRYMTQPIRLIEIHEDIQEED